MKKFIAVLAFLMTVFPGEANEYTQLLDNQRELEDQISQKEEIIHGNRSLWYKLTHSKREQEEEEEKLEKLKQKLQETKASIENIRNNTVVTITKLELQGVPDLDIMKFGHADLRLFFFSEGKRKPFFKRNDIGENVIIPLQDLELKRNDVIAIKDIDDDDADDGDFEDIDEIFCDDIIEEALKNSSDSGCYNKKKDIVQTHLTVRIYYRKYQKSERRR